MKSSQKNLLIFRGVFVEITQPPRFSVAQLERKKARLGLSPIALLKIRSPYLPHAWRRADPISEGVSATTIPASAIAAFFASAVPFPPETIAPA